MIHANYTYSTQITIAFLKLTIYLRVILAKSILLALTFLRSKYHFYWFRMSWCLKFLQLLNIHVYLKNELKHTNTE